MKDLEELRRCAVGWSLFRPTTLKRAVDRLGFVQADPIRAPARAQDLILRHRVKDYRAGDLERRYASLELEEDFLYVYGFFPRRTWRLLQARGANDLSEFERKVLAKVQSLEAAVHPRELDAHFGRERVVNAWGGFSQATKQALERLHHRNLLRVARREKGIRIYAAARDAGEVESPPARFRKLVMMVASLLAPAAAPTFTQVAARFRRWIPEVKDHRVVLEGLLRSGELERQVVEGQTYYWPAANRAPGRIAARVRFLAPFDPVVWDRVRFEHLWGWPYRFEAYTPPAKRLRGYYAMPLLWGTQVIGWANAKVTGGKLTVELGFVQAQPKEKQFRIEAEAEIERLRTFLKPRKS